MAYVVLTFQQPILMYEFGVVSDFLYGEIVVVTRKINSIINW